MLNPVEYYLEQEDELIIITMKSAFANSVFAKKEIIQSKFINDSDLINNLKIEYIMPEKQNVNDVNEESFMEEKACKGDDEFEVLLEDSSSNSSDSSNSDDKDKKAKTLTHNKKIKGSIFEKKKHFKIWENNSEFLSKSFEGHYLIFCKEEHILEFMQILGNYYSDLVFFVSDQHPSVKWDLIRRYYENLIYIECSYSDQEDLRKLRLEVAKHVYILTWSVENTNVSDSGILPLVKLIEERFPNCKYTLELSDHLNVRYLNEGRPQEENLDNEEDDIPEDEEKKEHNFEKEEEKMEMKNDYLEKNPYRYWPIYAKSDIFFPSSLDSLLAISFYNDGLLDVLLKIIGTGESQTPPPISMPEKGSTKRRISHMKQNSFDNVVLQSTFVKENNLINMLKYVGKDKVYYGTVFRTLLSLNEPIICLGIYRANKEKTELRNNCPYIITNPKSEVYVYKGDFIIVIGQCKSQFHDDYLRSQREIYDEIEKITIGRKLVMRPLSPSKHFMTKYIGPTPIDEMTEDDVLKGIETQFNILQSITEGTYVYNFNNNNSDLDILKLREAEVDTSVEKKNSVKSKFFVSGGLKRSSCISDMKLPEQKIDDKTFSGGKERLSSEGNLDNADNISQNRKKSNFFQEFTLEKERNKERNEKLEKNKRLSFNNNDEVIVFKRSQINSEDGNGFLENGDTNRGKKQPIGYDQDFINEETDQDPIESNLGNNQKDRNGDSTISDEDYESKKKDKENNGK